MYFRSVLWFLLAPARGFHIGPGRWSSLRTGRELSRAKSGGPMLQPMRRLLEVAGLPADPEFPRMAFREALDRFGSDAPDIRYEHELSDVTDIVRDSEFRAFSSVAESGGAIKALCWPGGAAAGRSRLDKLTDLAKSQGAKGLVWIHPAGDAPGLADPGGIRRRGPDHGGDRAPGNPQRAAKNRGKSHPGGGSARHRTENVATKAEGIPPGGQGLNGRGAPN